MGVDRTGKDRVHQDVENQPGGKEEHKDGEHDGHAPFHHLGLNPFHGGCATADGVLDNHQSAHTDGHNVVRIGRTQILDPEPKGALYFKVCVGKTSEF